MAKNDDPRKDRLYGPGEGESAADAMNVDAVSRDSKDYVLVEKRVAEADGLRIEEQILKSDLEDMDVSLEDDNVREALPASERPTSDLSDEEKEAEGRE